jgi:cysteine desulfurase
MRSLTYTRRAMERAYFDHAGTSPLTPQARAILTGLASLGNPSSVHAEGQRARAALEEARARLAAALHVEDDEIVFTGSGTEADNLALRGVVWAAGGRPHVVTTAIEHQAVRRTARWLAEKGHVSLTVIEPDEQGIVDPSRIAEALRSDTALVSMMLVNNELGTIQEVASVARECGARGIRLHVDAVQAVGRMPLLPRDLGADLLALSAHKAGGPAGVGVLFVRRGVKLQPILCGGEQESGLRPGTENVAMLAAGAEALALALDEQAERAARLRTLTRRLEQSLLALAGARLHGDPERRAPGITNVGFEGVPGDVLLRALDLEGFAVSTGSACTSGSIAASHVIEALGLPKERAREAMRLSLGTSNTEAEIDRLLDVLPRALAAARDALKRPRANGRPIEENGGSGRRLGAPSRRGDIR